MAESIRETKTDSCGWRLAGSIWPTAEVDKTLAMKFFFWEGGVYTSQFPVDPFFFDFASLLLSPATRPIHFLSESPEHLLGLVMGAQLSHCFPSEAANNLLCGP